MLDTKEILPSIIGHVQTTLGGMTGLCIEDLPSCRNTGFWNKSEASMKHLGSVLGTNENITFLRIKVESMKHDTG